MQTKRRWILALAVGLLALPVGAADEAETPEEAKKRKIRFHGELRARGEVDSNYTDFNDDGGFFDPSIPVLVPDDTVSFFAYRVRLAMEADITEKLVGQVELQVADIAGEDQQERNVLLSNRDPVDLYTGYIHWNQIADSHWSLRVGRQELPMGNQFLFGNLPYYNGVSFDSVRIHWEDEARFDAWWAKTNETFQGDADTDIFSFAIGGTAERGDDWSFYTHYLRDDGISGIERETLLAVGFRWTRQEGDASHFLWNFEFVWQDGRIGNPVVGGMFIPPQPDPILPLPTGTVVDDLFISAWGGEGMFGYNWNKNDDDHQLYLHAYLATGDRNQQDDDINDFRTFFQNFHPRNGRADIVRGTNLNSIGLAYEGTYGDRHGAGVDVLLFQINAPEDSPTTLASTPGLFNGFFIPATDSNPSPGITRGEDDLGQELDLWYDYYYSENLSFQVLLALFFPGDAITKVNGGFDDPASRLAVQARLRF